jgi:hypothetical protein
MLHIPQRVGLEYLIFGEAWICPGLADGEMPWHVHRAISLLRLDGRLEVPSWSWSFVAAVSILSHEGRNQSPRSIKDYVLSITFCNSADSNCSLACGHIRTALGDPRYLDSLVSVPRLGSCSNIQGGRSTFSVHIFRSRPGSSPSLASIARVVKRVVCSVRICKRSLERNAKAL